MPYFTVTTKRTINLEYDVEAASPMKAEKRINEAIAARQRLGQIPYESEEIQHVKATPHD